MSISEKDSLIYKQRHTFAHLLAWAVLDLYGGKEKVKLGVGPVIDNGFYYDFNLEERIAVTDLPKIQKRMKQLMKNGFTMTGNEMKQESALEQVNKENQPYKAELINDLPDDEKITFYTLESKKEDSFTDLCAGNHVDTQKELGVFALTKVSGAYWKSDESKDQMQRIYGVAFETQEELDTYLAMLEEAAKRDHRKLGRELDFFTFSELVGAGLPLWTPRGTKLREALDNYIQEMRSEHGYGRVTIPHITKQALYETSGHWEKFGDELFHVSTREGHEYALKPMNCPHHTQIFASKQRSYRDMPQRYAETTMVYRDEQSGELSGLSRVLSITQDDAHVFCREDQVEEELLKIWDIIDTFYKACGFEELKIELSLHDPEEMDKYLGDEKVWEKTEDQLRKVAKKRGVEVIENIGEAAFYGPKIDIIAFDSLGRRWQVATIQVDRNMPNRFNLSCVNEKGDNEEIVMLHAAITGSLERFLSVLIEHHAGKMPVWMSPEQVRIISVGESHIEHVNELTKEFTDAGILAEADTGNESVGKKIRSSAHMKIPYVLVIGDKEIGADNLSIRYRGQEDLLEMSKADFFDKVTKEISERSA